MKSVGGPAEMDDRRRLGALKFITCSTNTTSTIASGGKLEHHAGTYVLNPILSGIFKQ